MTSRSVIIALPVLSPAEVVILKRYLHESHLFSGAEWKVLRRTMTKLEQGIVRFGAQEYRFPQFYRTFINGTYAYPFLSALAQLTDLECEGVKAQAQVAQQIFQWLQRNGIQAGQVPQAEYLITFCLAQWGAFARGYLFETMVVRDLQQQGITVTVHDPIHERFAPYDLYIPSVGYGDVKSSRYFLDDLVAETPVADFYITRIYSPMVKGYQFIVFLTPLAWNRLWRNQRQPVSTAATLDAALPYLAQGVRVRIEHLVWIVVEYGVWQQWVRVLQKELTHHESDL